jgi:hypothetical protein
MGAVLRNLLLRSLTGAMGLRNSSSLIGTVLAGGTALLIAQQIRRREGRSMQP